MAAPGLPLPPTSLLQHWGCRGPPDPEGYSSSSPAASPDSCGLSSPAAARGPRSGPAAPRGPSGRKRERGAGGPRQSASEREKLRMRRLAQALLRLRHYLPPALAPAGQSLTKIETLRLAARYIAHLSALLGLSEEALARRRGGAGPALPALSPGPGVLPEPGPPPAPARAGPAPRFAPRRCGLGVTSHGRDPPAAARGYRRGAGGLGAITSLWRCSRAPPGGARGSRDGAGSVGVAPLHPFDGDPPELHSAIASNACSWPSPLHGAGASPDLPGDPLVDAGLMLPEFVDAGTVTQDLSADLLSLLEALLPPQHQD